MTTTIHNSQMIKHLVMKDWALMKKSIAAYMLAGIVTLGIMGMATAITFNIAAILMITLLIVIGARSAIESIVNEKKEQTLPFILSLPVTPQDYAFAKLLSNLVLYFVPWLILVLGMLVIIVSTPIYNGVIPLVILVSAYILAAYCCYLATALLTYSEGFTISVMIVTNLLLNGFIILIMRLPELNQTFEAATASWNATSLLILAALITFSAAILLLTGILQKRLTSFL
ncbi:ABC transporter permease [Paraglaciecola sp. 25GB23A]|uniref:ABC transporter permease n=1 Tax=Paraglaciecola sp. 25GB23A TaxID=3156068 RepID=UPI0032AEA699